VESILRFFVSFLVDLVLSFPGAAIRWLFLRKSHTLKEIHEKDLRLNGKIGLLAVLLLGGIYYLIRYIFDK
jgi:hypothetical protein